jgi:hypothetical protein
MDEDVEAALMRALVGNTGASGIEVAHALRKDAERYRWLRDIAFTATAVRLVQHIPSEMDEAIDHAMQMDGSRTGGLLVLHNVEVKAAG